MVAEVRVLRMMGVVRMEARMRPVMAMPMVRPRLRRRGTHEQGQRAERDEGRTKCHEQAPGARSARRDGDEAATGLVPFGRARMAEIDGAITQSLRVVLPTLAGG